MVPEKLIKDAEIAVPDPETADEHEANAIGENEDHVCMRATIPQHIDDHFSKVEDMAGTGECDSLGG